MTNPSIAAIDEEIDEHCCASCGVPYTKHLGLHGTCDELIHAKKEIAKWKSAYEQLHRLLMGNDNEESSC